MMGGRQDKSFHRVLPCRCVIYFYGSPPYGSGFRHSLAIAKGHFELKQMPQSLAQLLHDLKLHDIARIIQ